jgi:hypothetical protein
MDMRRAHCESGCGVVLLVGVVCERVFCGDMRVGVVSVGRDLDCGVVDTLGDTHLDTRGGGGARVSPGGDVRMSPKSEARGRGTFGVVKSV